MRFEDFIRKLNELDPEKNSTIITWGNMDMKVLKQNCMFNHIPFPFKGEMRDLSLEYKNFFGDRTLTGLWKAAEEYGDSGTGTHHKALDDALTAYKLFKLASGHLPHLQRAECFASWALRSLCRNHRKRCRDESGYKTHCHTQKKQLVHRCNKAHEENAEGNACSGCHKDFLVSAFVSEPSPKRGYQKRHEKCNAEHIAAPPLHKAVWKRAERLNV